MVDYAVRSCPMHWERASRSPPQLASPFSRIHFSRSSFVDTHAVQVVGSSTTSADTSVTATAASSDILFVCLFVCLENVPGRCRIQKSIQTLISVTICSLIFFICPH